MDETRRRKLADTMTQPSSIEDVIEAITRFGERPYAKIYVERRGAGYRWSIAHRGGPYPLLREVAKFLDVPHTSVLVHSTTVDGWTVVALTGPLPNTPEAWAIIDATADKRQITARLAELDQRPEDSLERSPNIASTRD